MEQPEHNKTLHIQEFKSEEELYESITAEGSLGLLAYGYRGLQMWRKKRAELEKTKPTDNQKKENE